MNLGARGPGWQGHPYWCARDVVRGELVSVGLPDLRLVMVRAAPFGPFHSCAQNGGRRNLDLLLLLVVRVAPFAVERFGRRGIRGRRGRARWGWV